MIRRLLVGILAIMALSMSAQEVDIDKALAQMDRALSHRDDFIRTRQNRIDSIQNQLAMRSVTRLDSLSRLRQIAMEYTSFNNDSAITYFNSGIALAQEYPYMVTELTLRRAAILPLVGMNDRAVVAYESINPDSLTLPLKIVWYDGARQMYGYISQFFAEYPEITDPYREKSLEAINNLLPLLDHSSNEYYLNMGQYLYHNDDADRAAECLEHVIDTEPEASTLRARAAHILSQIERDRGNEDKRLYYLLLSAISDLSTATLEVASLQELGEEMHARGDIPRAYRYLSAAIENAVDCRAKMRMVESTRSLPLIEGSYSAEVKRWRTNMIIIVTVLIALLITVIMVAFALRRQIQRMEVLQNTLRESNSIKEVYISRFMMLCSIYMEKLTQFCQLTARKISTGNTDDLYNMVRSGKFIEQESRDFYEVFDDAFLHICPNFYEDVNRLLLPERQITLAEGERMNTELRILAFIRLGIDDAAQIARTLNYSINTIYAYRNRLRDRAIDRPNFEANIRKL